MKKHPFIFATFLIALSLPIALNVSASDYGLLYVNEITPQTIAAMFKQPLSILKQKGVAIKVLTPKFIGSSGFMVISTSNSSQNPI